MWVFIFTGAGVPLLGVSLARVWLYRRLYPQDRTGRTDRSGHPDSGPIGLYEAAYLERGRRGVAEVALCALHLGGSLTVAADGRVTAVRAAPEPNGDGPGRDPVQAAALALLGGEAPPHAATFRTGVGDCPAAVEVERSLVGRGLAVDPRRRERAENAELAQAVCVLVAVLATVAACIVDSATGQGTGLRPFLAFTVLGTVTGLVSLFAGTVRSDRHATAAGLRRSREAAADETWAPPLPSGVPAAARAALTAVARNGPGSGGVHGLAPLTAHLRPRPAPGTASPATREPPSVGGCGAGCGGGI
ncbi:TIGR04222 domain-containing membrane protein [Streptomyces sp. NPDC051183]|uniref:TIGR04222 domain-containing membrane protein n=1 Tax=Streptomyces sp. NPDC051183 TaxID=3155165 RepID=UPI0034416FA8